MKLLIDFFPLLLFFAAYKLDGIFTATAVMMVATVLQTWLIYRMDGRLQTLHKVTLVLVLGFGALTLGLHDERFIKWKPTVLYLGIALALLVAQFGFRRNALTLLLGEQLRLAPSVWARLNLAWVLYAVFMAALNAYVAHFFSTEFWVSFKLWGYVFPLVFILGQAFYIARHLPREDRS
ncbi:MAG: putative intracellular septation protein [Pseudomonadota bacterium]|jgi:intracellular septation protein